MMDLKDAPELESFVNKALNMGHGHVKPRPDGMKARCGGPAICKVCAAEAGKFPGRKPAA